jgi:hypothetical protein
LLLEVAEDSKKQEAQLEEGIKNAGPWFQRELFQDTAMIAIQSSSMLEEGMITNRSLAQRITIFLV